MEDQKLKDDLKFLEHRPGFQDMPLKIKAWITKSPNATREFAEFFRHEGRIDSSGPATLPAYLPSERPKIFVDSSTWRNLLQPDAAAYPQAAMFSQLSHEIGHDRYNTASMPFKGATADEYVSYRAEIEAQAIFNAFPIFKDLEQDPSFQKQFNQIGYVSGLELGHLYGEWKKGALDDATVVAQIAKSVPSKTYTIDNPPADEDHDGVLTHRDKYLQDFRNVVKPRAEPSVPALKGASTSIENQGEALNQLSVTDRALFDRIRQDVPPSISDAHVAQAMLGAIDSRVERAGDVARVAVEDGRLFLVGTMQTGLGRVALDLSQPASPISESVQQAQTLHRQHEQHALATQQSGPDDPGKTGPRLV